MAKLPHCKSFEIGKACGEIAAPRFSKVMKVIHLQNWLFACFKKLLRNAALGLSEKGRRAAIEVLAHLQAHPEAKDTIEGIRQWWLTHPDEIGSEDLEEAVRVLTDRGLLRTWETGKGREVFGPTVQFLHDPAVAIEVLRGNRK